MSDATGDEPVKKKKPAKPTKAPKRTIDPNAPLELTWRLQELPSAQHRAGLAGLALCVEFLGRNPARKGRCEVRSIDRGGLTLVVDRQGMQGLFDDIYDAATVETSSRTQWKGDPPKRIDELATTDERGRAKTEKRYIYDRVVPRGALIGEWDAGATEPDKLWLKLWRDMVWSTLRGVPAQREPFNARAERRATDDGEQVWLELAERPDAAVDLPSTYALGVQAKSAENVPFEDVARMRFLLHFWPFVVAIYVPALLKRDGTRGFVGYSLAISDVAELDTFVEAWREVARGRGVEPSGYVPREAVIDIAAEAALDVARRCTERVAMMEAGHTDHVIAGVEVFHIERDGNNVRLRSVARVTPDRPMIDEYGTVRRADYWSPVFRRQRILNVLERRPWWSGFARLCSITPDEMTIRHNPFQHDCKMAFTEVEMTMSADDETPTLEQLVYKRVQAYVLGRTKRKYDISWDDVKDGPEARRTDYVEKRGKVAREAFLAVRSRTGADFVAYFTSTICSVPQRANEERFLELARALMNPNDTEMVRSLTLLALSAVG